LATPYAMAYPDAEVHAIDVAPGLLRYAHARAESLGVAVHFHQRGAEDTKFPDDYFDLVVSHNAMHEMAQKTTESMFKESYRILKPGGIAVHQDLRLRFDEFPLFEQFDFRWDQLHNNEPYLVTYATNNPDDLFLQAGFPKENIWSGMVDQPDGTMKWFVPVAQKPAS
ncbi:MAG: class I SAM-dependent methyltransferase, partial [Rhodospirillaceae bacterium]|nr:class I SAM-dependent methyltransferase [Rhodospirillaceae bacterium]